MNLLNLQLLQVYHWPWSALFICPGSVDPYEQEAVLWTVLHMRGKSNLCPRCLPCDKSEKVYQQGSNMFELPSWFPTQPVTMEAAEKRQDATRLADSWWDDWLGCHLQPGSPLEGILCSGTVLPISSWNGRRLSGSVGLLGGCPAGTCTLHGHRLLQVFVHPLAT